MTEPCRILMTFTIPEYIGLTPWSLLWSLPLLASICIVYKATKVHNIRFKSFTKETASLFGSIMVFLAAAAIVLCVIAWLFNEKMALLAGR